MIDRKYDDFVPSNIFKKDSQENDIYFLWGKFGNGYIINDPTKKERLIDLEGYKHFFVSYKPPILLPIIIFALVIAIGVSFLTDYQGELKQIMFSITLVVYIMALTIYFFTISRILNGCEKVSKAEKRWILENS